MPFPVWVRYWEKGRAPDRLWVTPLYLDDEGGVLLYAAVGPAGKPAAAHLVSGVDLRRMPNGARVQVISELDSYGRQVYGRLNHTAN
jgi:hypothetical protein